ncbi:MAG: hypothetical protein JSU63_17595 [Phycisphaerales bacterium]|nr:MAG: hypothetical protein JSU63_17595 [Phycisphaerales bacterium]
MPYNVDFDETDRIVIVQVSGAASRDDHHRARDEAWRLCRENGCSKALIDLRELNTSRASTLSCFTFGESVSQTAPNVRLAHVLPTDVKSKNDVKFTSTVEANRGLATGEFDSIEEAKRWLLGATCAV